MTKPPNTTARLSHTLRHPRAPQLLKYLSCRSQAPNIWEMWKWRRSFGVISLQHRLHLPSVSANFRWVSLCAPTLFSSYSQTLCRTTQGKNADIFCYPNPIIHFCSTQRRRSGGWERRRKRHGCKWYVEIEGK